MFDTILLSHAVCISLVNYTMCNHYQLMPYVGGLYDSDQTGLSRGLRIDFFY